MGKPGSASTLPAMLSAQRVVPVDHGARDRVDASPEAEPDAGAELLAGATARYDGLADDRQGGCLPLWYPQARALGQTFKFGGPSSGRRYWDVDLPSRCAYRSRWKK